jgi:Dehydrogenases with different specificities (related to short-chain alcohol dehydrogenases)
LSENGAHIIIADLNLEKAKEVAADLNRLNGAEMTAAIYCDVSSEDSVREMCEWVTCEYGGIDVMHSNAGISKAGGLEK